MVVIVVVVSTCPEKMLTSPSGVVIAAAVVEDWVVIPVTTTHVSTKSRYSNNSQRQHWNFGGRHRYCHPFVPPPSCHHHQSHSFYCCCGRRTSFLKLTVLSERKQFQFYCSGGALAKIFLRWEPDERTWRNSFVLVASVLTKPNPQHTGGKFL